MKIIQQRKSKPLSSDKLDASAMLSELLQNPIKNNAARSIVIGTINSITTTGLINLTALDSQQYTAFSLCSLASSNIGEQCAFMLTNGSDNQGVIIGLLQHTVYTVNVSSEKTNLVEKTIELNYPEGFSIQCGESSLTLNPDGKVEIRGTRIINHASELHRIKAGSVRIN